ncbi:acyltransferase family protein, partial [Empedobacter sp.]|uniref:acyltransferase family protein n=1 Tax=Empedobacter sp. TaxID=1927715 RepID=UPI0028AF3E76
MKTSRISILDGLRVFAILIVIISHYLHKYDLHGNQFLEFVQNYGYFGVPFFFVISGFVILYSLETTNSYKDFLKKRYIRLAPGMLICSILPFSSFIFI